MRDSILYTAIGGFIVGVAARSFFDFGFAFVGFLILLGFSLLFVYSSVLKNLRIDAVVLFAVAVIAVGCGTLRFDIADLDRGDSVLEQKIGFAVVAEGELVDEPDERENTVHLVIRLDTADGEKVAGKALVFTERYPEFQYGDRVRIIGALEKPESFETDTGKIFDYPGFLAKDGIFYQIPFAKVFLVSSGGGNVLKRELFALKNEFLERIESVIPEPQAALLGGLVVGAKQSLGKELLDDFRKTGVIHVVVLSGYNLTLVAGALMWFLGKFLRKKWGLLVGALSIVLFVIMVGASATAVRAGIMALLVLLAQGTGRTYAITRALILAGFVMVLHNPYILLFDPSFQLSFLATVGLIQLAPRVEKYFRFVPTTWKLREIVGATIATQIFVLPLLLYMSGEFSIVGLLVNLLILPLISLTMLFGFLTGIVGFVSTILSMPFAFISYALLTYELKIVELFSSLPFAAVTISYFSLWLMVLLYIALGAFLWLKTKPTSN